MRSLLIAAVVAAAGLLIVWADPASTGEPKKGAPRLEKGVSAIRAKGSGNAAAIGLPNLDTDPVKDTDLILDDLSCDLVDEGDYKHQDAYAKFYFTDPATIDIFPPSDAIKYTSRSGNTYTWSSKLWTTSMGSCWYVVWGIYADENDPNKVLVHRRAVQCHCAFGMVIPLTSPALSSECWYPAGFATSCEPMVWQCQPRMFRRLRR